MKKMLRDANIYGKTRYVFCFVTKYQRDYFAYDPLREAVKQCVYDFAFENQCILDTLIIDNSSVYIDVTLPAWMYHKKFISQLKSLTFALAKELARSDDNCPFTIKTQSIWSSHYFVQTIGNKVSQYDIDTFKEKTREQQ